MSVPASNENDLLFKLRQGDERAFAEIYNQYKGMLFLHAYRMVQDADEAHDVVHELFASLWSKRENLEIKTSIKAYLYNAVKNRILDFIAHQKVVSRYVDSLDNFVEKGEFYVDDKLREKELEATIAMEVSLLPEKMREVFELSRNFNYSHKQIAEILGISDKTVKKQVANAVKILRNKINAVVFIFSAL
ncbi:RNA polymerase sigma factor [Desertivirga arenae]|uniref:RNA polymerase sigma factor n=1 Tax=Desertivirga arenae TaxID=2810309 RepID=UPI001A96770C|nr:RNA polymerase sigma-70 factor [Pedobacter sp. SYSU D00823]